MNRNRTQRAMMAATTGKHSRPRPCTSISSRMLLFLPSLMALLGLVIHVPVGAFQSSTVPSLSSSLWCTTTTMTNGNHASIIASSSSLSIAKIKCGPSSTQQGSASAPTAFGGSSPLLTTLPLLHISFSSSLRRSRLAASSSSSSSSSREQEIRRKIRQLKKEGRITGNWNNAQPSPDATSSDNDDNDGGSDNDNVNVNVNNDVYADKVRQKLGKTKSRLLGFGNGGSSSNENANSEETDERNRIQAEMDQIQAEIDQLDQVNAVAAAATATASGGNPAGVLGSLSNFPDATTTTSTMASSIEDIMSGDTVSRQRRQQQQQQQQQQRQVQIDPRIFDRPQDSTREPEMTEEELVELVANKLAEKRAVEDAAIEAAAKARREAQQNNETAADATVGSDSGGPPMTTSGIGGTWVKRATTTTEKDLYKPKTGSWGAFPRPKDISKAYGGGRRVGAGFSNEGDAVASMNTQKLLKEYRRKVGIDVPSEKEHASEIEDALKIGQLAMQRGIYGTAVSALEKVTQWCSTNSKVGSKVYLELAMAYEAVGRTKEAYQVYTTLTECRMEDVKFNAKRLLYGMEAMEIMRDVSSEFSRTKTRNTFIDATGLDTIAQNFDDVYQTAYVDLDGNFYKHLTESVVRSPREARQILLKATGKGEVGRMRVVQALRCLARQFDDCLKSELSSAAQEEPTAYLNGKPIVKGAPAPGLGSLDPMVISLGDFALLSSQEMVQNLAGKWRLQLLADKQGDGVSFFNTTTAVQDISIEDMTFSATGPSGLATVETSGDLEMEDSKRILTRPNLEVSGGFLGVFRGARESGFLGAISREQQVVSVDSILLITKSAPGSRTGRNAEKEHFAVWRRLGSEDAS